MPKIKTTKEDKLWAMKVKERDNHACIICKDTKLLNAHHIIPRQIKELRHDLNNGVTLCPKHHRFSFKFSAHQNPLAFFIWLQEHKPTIYNYAKSKIRHMAERNS